MKCPNCNKPLELLLSPEVLRSVNEWSCPTGKFPHNRYYELRGVPVQADKVKFSEDF